MAGKVTVVRSLQFHSMLKILVSVWTGQNCNVITALGKGADSLHKQMFMSPIRSQASVFVGNGCRSSAGTPWWYWCAACLWNLIPSTQEEYILNHPSSNCAFPSESNTLSEQSLVRRRCLWRGIPSRLPLPAGWPWLYVILTFGDILFRWEQFGSRILCNTRPRK